MGIDSRHRSFVVRRFARHSLIWNDTIFVARCIDSVGWISHFAIFQESVYGLMKSKILLRLIAIESKHGMLDSIPCLVVPCPHQYLLSTSFHSREWISLVREHSSISMKPHLRAAPIIPFQPRGVPYKICVDRCHGCESFEGLQSP